MAEEFDIATASLGGHGGLGSGSGTGPGHNRGANNMNDYDERMQDLKKHIRSIQDQFRRSEMRRKKSEQEKAEKWIEYKAEVRKKRDDELQQRLLREQRAHQPRHRNGKVIDTELQPRLRTQGSGQIAGCTQGSGQVSSGVGAENGSRASSVVIAPVRGESEGDVDSRVSTARKSQIFPPIAECRESSRGSEGSSKRRHVRKAMVTIPRPRKKKDDVASTPRVGTQREKSIMQVAKEEFQGLCKSADGRAILKMGSKRQQMHREALVRSDKEAVEETRTENGEEHAEDERRKAFDKLSAALEAVSVKSITDFRTRTEVPRPAQNVAVASICMVAGISETVEVGPDGLPPRTWEAAKLNMANSGPFVNSLRQFPYAVDSGRIADKTIYAANQCLQDISAEHLAEEPVALTLYEWIHAAWRYCEVVQLLRLQSSADEPDESLNMANGNQVQERPTVSNKHMARRYRLRMMQQITSQVLQCRRKMASNVQMSFLSAHDLDCGQPLEGII